MANNQQKSRIDAAMRGIPLDSIRPRSRSFEDLRISLGTSTLIRHFNASTPSLHPTGQLQSGSSSIYSDPAQTGNLQVPNTRTDDHKSVVSSMESRSNYTAESQIPEPLSVVPKTLPVNTIATAESILGSKKHSLAKVRNLAAWRPTLSPQRSVDFEDSPIGPHPAVRPPTRSSPLGPHPAVRLPTRNSLIGPQQKNHSDQRANLSRTSATDLTEVESNRSGPTENNSAGFHTANDPRTGDGRNRIVLPSTPGYNATNERFPVLHTIAAFLVYCAVGGLILSYGAFLAYYATVRFPQASPADLLLIGAMQPFFVFLFTPLPMPSFSTFSFRAVFLLGSGIFAACIMLTALCTQWWQALLSHGFGVGIGMGIVHKCMMESVTALHSGKHMRLVVGIAISGTTVGGIIFVVMIRELATAPPGQGPPNKLTGVYIGIVIFALLFSTTWMLPAIPQGQVQLPRNVARSLLSLLSLRQGHFWITVAGIFLTSGAVLIPFFSVVAYAIANRHLILLVLHGAQASMLLVYLNAVTFITFSLPSIQAYLAKTYSITLDIYLATAALSAIVVFITGSVTSIVAKVATGAFYGILATPLLGLDQPQVSSFKMKPGFFTCWPETNETPMHLAEINHIKVIIVSWTRALGFIIGPVIGGAFILQRGTGDGNWHGFETFHLYTGSLLLVGAVCFLVARVLSDVHLPATVMQSEGGAQVTS